MNEQSKLTRQELYEKLHFAVHAFLLETDNDPTLQYLQTSAQVCVMRQWRDRIFADIQEEQEAEAQGELPFDDQDGE